MVALVNFKKNAKRDHVWKSGTQKQRDQVCIPLVELGLPLDTCSVISDLIGLREAILYSTPEDLEVDLHILIAKVSYWNISCVTTFTLDRIKNVVPSKFSLQSLIQHHRA